MKVSMSGLVVLVSAVALGLILAAEDKKTGEGSLKNPAFERIKALSGSWDVKGGEEHGGGSGVTYRVTAGGSAVLETLFGGSPHEMVTLYYLEGDDLAMTHYCMLQNRPHMRAERASGADRIVFKCAGGDHAKIESEDHMHQATFRFIDADHLKTEWVLYKGGKPDSTHAFELTRKKK